MKKRGFVVAKGWENKRITLPKRQTRFSAGYDILAGEDIIVPPHSPEQKPTLIPTGLKVYMEDDEVLFLINRSSNPIKRGLVLPNSVGVIDKDYYENPDNDGHFFVQMINIKNEPYEIKKGEAIAQGIFIKYLITDDDASKGARTGGFGSTDRT